MVCVINDKYSKWPQHKNIKPKYRYRCLKYEIDGQNVDFMVINIDSYRYR